MKAVRYYGKEDIRVETVPDPKILNPRDAIVKITSTAICGSDLHLYGGFIPTMQKGDILGHEFMGEVVEVGRDNRRLEAQNTRLQMSGLPELIAQAPAMQVVLDTMQRIGPSDANVLILGEHGTGKEVVAQWLHAASERAEKPLVTVNAGGLSEGVAESELFGHVKGAFTGADRTREGKFAAAGRGTLLLDEIDTLPLEAQAGLLRIIETGEYEPVGSNDTQLCEARIIVASNWDLEEATEDGRFRPDLYYRLNVMSFHLPPLRERVLANCKARVVGGSPEKGLGEIAWVMRARGTTIPERATVVIALVREDDRWRVTEIRLMQ